MKFHLPEYKNSSFDLTERIKHQLRNSALLVKVCQIFVGGILPIVEGVLVNLATGTDKSPTPFIIAIIIIGFIHIILLVLLLTSETPLPQFLVQFDEQATQVKIVEAELSTYKSYSTAFIESTNATLYSMFEIEAMRLNPETDLSKVFERVLYPWIEQRINIFEFREGDAFYNFAVYMETEANLLSVIYRSHDNRIIPTNRSWRSGDGHVGSCFLQEETIFLFLSEGEVIPDTLKTSQPREEDKSYYVSMMATPIMINGKAKGVLVITSNKNKQFTKELHAPIIDTMGNISAQSVNYCYKENTNGKQNV